MLAIPFPLPGFTLTRVSQVENQWFISAQAVNSQVSCPACQAISTRVHSYYARSPKDLPLAGVSVRLKLTVRRFRCLNSACPRTTFAERLPEIINPFAQRTLRLEATLKIFTANLSAKTATRLLKKLQMPASPNTLLRLLKQEELKPVSAPKVLGVDDFAFRRGRTYGTLLLDLETHRPVDLLPDRTAASLKEWLLTHKGVEIISRDRSTEYARGASEGAPQALQIADRWHILKNLREALEKVISRVHAKLVAAQKAVFKSEESRPTEKRWRSRQQVQQAKVARARRQQGYEEVVELYKAGHKILEIAEELGMSRGTVRNFVKAGAYPERANVLRVKSILEPYEEYLGQRWAKGCTNAKQLWREIKEQGYTGSYKVVGRWTATQREKPGRKHSKRELGRIMEQEAEVSELESLAGGVQPVSKGGNELEAEMKKVQEEGEVKPPHRPLEAPRNLVWLLLRQPSTLKQEEREVLEYLRQVQSLETAYQLGQWFLRIVRKKQAGELGDWIAASKKSQVADLESFGTGLKREFKAIEAALTYAYSNGPTEGNINKLKLIKRSLYGRGSFELLKRRVLKAA